MTSTLHKPTPLLILDLDGTVRHGKDQLGRFVNGPGDVVIFPEAIEQMSDWHDRGGRIIGVTNQGGIALGYVTAENVKAAIAVTYEQTARLFNRIAFCPHHPDAADINQRRCWCRKPAPGLAIEAATMLGLHHPDETYPLHLALMVGDRPEDEACAAGLGVRFQWAEDWRSG